MNRLIIDFQLLHIRVTCIQVKMLENISVSINVVIKLCLLRLRMQQDTSKLM